MIVGSKEYMYAKYGQEQVNSWLQNVEMKNLYWCFGAFSNESIKVRGMEHREHYMNTLEAILNEKVGGLYPSVTYGVCPSTICRDEIGKLTGRYYGNLEIATFLIQEKIKELKQWLLENHKFTEREIKLLHYDVKGDIDAIN